MDGFTTGAREVGTIEGDNRATVGAVEGSREYSQLLMMEE